MKKIMSVAIRGRGVQSGDNMKRVLPINTTPDGCSFTIVTRYEGRAYLKSMTSGGGYYPATGVLEIYEDNNKAAPRME